PPHPEEPHLPHHQAGPAGTPSAGSAGPAHHRPHRRRVRMSGHGSPTAPIPHQPGTRLAIVAATWHEQVMDGLLAGALRGAAEAGIAEPTVVRAPGSFE